MTCPRKMNRMAAGGRHAVIGMAAAGVVAAILSLSGCSTSAPRFREEDRGDTSDGENEIRFASKIHAEETSEDDRVVDPARWKELSAPRHPLPSREDRTPGGLSRDMVLLEAVSYLGVPYSYGGNGKAGIDCSGYTSMVYQRGASIRLPRSTRGQYGVGSEVERDSLLFGDLVFFNTTGHAPSHVGIYLEDGLFAHASVSYGVTISSLESTYYRRRFVGGRRVVQDVRERGQE